MTRVLIVVEGGVIQVVAADGPVAVSIKDWDEIKDGNHYDPNSFNPVDPSTPAELSAAARDGIDYPEETP